MSEDPPVSTVAGVVEPVAPPPWAGADVAGPSVAARWPPPHAASARARAAPHRTEARGRVRSMGSQLSEPDAAIRVGGESGRTGSRAAHDRAELAASLAGEARAGPDRHRFGQVDKG